MKREVTLLIFFVFIFPSDNTVNSVETWWMCFHLSRMMTNIACCSTGFSREIALIPGDTFYHSVPYIIRIFIMKIFRCLLPPRKLTVYFYKI